MPQSLQCPRCNGAVSVSEDAAGKRVQCPHCEQTFLAPGFALGGEPADDEDDWLQLEEPPKRSQPVSDKAAPVSDKAEGGNETGSTSAATPPPSETPPTKRTGSGTKASRGTPELSADDEELLAQFAGDDDDFMIKTEQVPKPEQSPSSGSATGAAATGPAASTPTPQQARDVELATEYRVKCKVCGSVMHVNASQAGQTMSCSDCYTEIKIPPPPKVQRAKAMDLDQAETYNFEPSKAAQRGADPFQKSAAKLLEDASREDEEEEETPDGYDTPSVKEWAFNVFGIYKDLGVVAHWLGLSALGCLPAAVVLSLESPILVLGLFPAGFFLGVLVVSCGFAILQSVANEEERVSEWPTLDPMAWLEQLFVAVAAASLAAVPAWIVCILLFGPHLLSLAVTMFAVYVLFPFVLLSMLDMNSAFVPFSPEVARSVRKCEEAWGGFYFSSGLLFAGLFMLIVAMSGASPTTLAIVSITASIAIAFAYFSIIGRLAFAIGQEVNAPPMQNDIDRTRPSEH